MSEPLEVIIDPTPTPDPAPVAFDPKTLSPEALSYIDQQRTNASKSAAVNAKNKLMKDESFLTSLKEQIEIDQNLTVEEKMRLKELDFVQKAEKLTLRENTLSTTKSLLEHGMTSESADALASLLTTTDADISVKNVDTFTTLFDEALRVSTEKATQDLLQNGHVINTNGNKGSASFQEQYAAATVAKNFSEQIRIKTLAAKEGVFLT